MEKLMNRSFRGRRLCADENCTVEIEEEKKFCDGHAYLIDSWIKKSQDDLKRYIAKAKGGTHD